MTLSNREEAGVQKHKVKEAAYYIRERCPAADTAIVLGSGLMMLAEQLTERISFPYAEIPFFPESTVSGHSGELTCGLLGGKMVMTLSGRFHFYEGHAPEAVIFPVRVLHELGVDKLILTNAAGGVNTDFQAGSLMRITDHLNLMGFNPLTGYNVADWGPRFPDLSQAYDLALGALTDRAARDLGVTLHQGVYAAFAGPSYETPAEIRMARTLGADAVGMSTVPEVIAARHMGLRVLAVSCITNAAAGIEQAAVLSHQEVLEASRRAGDDFCRLLTEVVRRLDKEG